MIKLALIKKYALLMRTIIVFVIDGIRYVTIFTFFIDIIEWSIKLNNDANDCLLTCIYVKCICNTNKNKLTLTWVKILCCIKYRVDQIKIVLHYLY